MTVSPLLELHNNLLITPPTIHKAISSGESARSDKRTSLQDNLAAANSPPRSSYQSQHDQQSNPTTLPSTPVSSPASKSRTTIIILQLSTINFLTSFTSGIITIGIPSIAASISLERSLYLWPSSVYGLTAGATLLIAGSIADLIGARKVDLTGCLLVGVFTLACGFSQTGIQLVLFRAMQGLAVSLHLPSSVALVAAAVPAGKSRNIGFSCLGLSQPLGFSFGLVLAGIMIEKIGWRSPFYLSGAAMVFVATAGFWALPHVEKEVDRKIMHNLWTKIDWIGGGIASGGLAMLSYVLATLSADTASIAHPASATLLAIGVILVTCFPLWMRHQERRGNPALIPNSLWKELPFTSTCIMVGISYGYSFAMELFSSLYFQQIQNSTPLSASLRLLPNLIVGTLINLTTGLFVDKFPARWLVAGASFLCAVAPLMMAVVNPEWSYWYMEFWAQLLAPLAADVLFTVGLVIVSEVFPEDTQALAGAVFNTVAQFGSSLGVNAVQVVSEGVAGGTETGDLLKGYRASFWMMFGSMLLCGLLAVGGLRRAGRIGLKRE